MKIFIVFNIGLLICADLLVISLFFFDGWEGWMSTFLTNTIIGPIQFISGIILSMTTSFKSRFMNLYLMTSLLLIALTTLSSELFFGLARNEGFAVSMLGSLLLGNFYPLVLSQFNKEKKLWKPIN